MRIHANRSAITARKLSSAGLLRAHEFEDAGASIQPPPAAFTIYELLVVVAMCAVLTLLLASALARARSDSKSLTCLSNLRRLTMAWQMYAQDNLGKLPQNGSRTTTPLVPTDARLRPGAAWYQWCPGSMNVFSVYETNFVMVGSVYPYIQSMSTYHCPADNFVWTIGTSKVPHVRSYSMNCYLAPIKGGEWPSLYTKNYYKPTDISAPAPSKLYVFIGESEYSINDGFFVSDPTQGNYWQDMPASHHAGACGLSYADGHAQLRRWTDVNVLRYTGYAHSLAGDPNSTDSWWLSERATAYNP